MKAAEVCVRMEVPLNEDDLKDMSDPAFMCQAIEYMRSEADKLAATVGGHVVTDRTPSFVPPQVTSHAILGGNWLLMASKWWVEVPDHVDVDAFLTN